MNKSFKHLPYDKRKKILLICDDIRVHSGVATIAKEIVTHTSHHFNWVQIAGAMKHPESGKQLDLSEAINNEANIKDSYVKLYPTNGYGNSTLLRNIIKIEKPDALFLITDPRYFTWVFNMENEIRKQIPITYLNIWDNYPAPLFNKPYYEACDLLMGISKQTVNINKLVLKGSEKNKIFRYIPHGKDPNVYCPIDKNNIDFTVFKKSLLGNQDPKFILFFNSRNIRRKQIPDTLLAFRYFLDTLPEKEAKECLLLLKTESTSDAGTNLKANIELFFGEKYANNVKIIEKILSVEQLNWLYNLADAQILLTSNEGWGLTLTEAMLTGTPIIANVTGGMQDQMRFKYDFDEGPGVKEGEWIDFDKDFPSNHRGTYKQHGKWAFPVYPSNISVQGSPPTPYIFDDRCSYEDAAKIIKKVYNLSNNERIECGLEGRKWAMGDEAGFTSKHQANRVIDALNTLFDVWKPKEKYEIVNATEYKGKFLNHQLNY